MRISDIILVILFIIVVIIAIIYSTQIAEQRMRPLDRTSDRVRSDAQSRAEQRMRDAPRAEQRWGRGRSKLEANIIRTLEKIFNNRYKFDQAHPTWLRESVADDTCADESAIRIVSRCGVILELDGYNEEMKVAIEVQGPGHIKPIPGDTYEKYQKRIARDVLKRRLCAEHGVHLITVDYRISPINIEPYLRSRLFDIGLCVKPLNYIKELNMVPWIRGQ